MALFSRFLACCVMSCCCFDSSEQREHMGDAGSEIGQR